MFGLSEKHAWFSNKGIVFQNSMTSCENEHVDAAEI
jgi:hypothetical protein